MKCALYGFPRRLPKIECLTQGDPAEILPDKIMIVPHYEIDVL